MFFNLQDFSGLFQSWGKLLLHLQTSVHVVCMCMWHGECPSTHAGLRPCRWHVQVHCWGNALEGCSLGHSKKTPPRSQLFIELSHHDWHHDSLADDQLECCTYSSQSIDQQLTWTQARLGTNFQATSTSNSTQAWTPSENLEIQIRSNQGSSLQIKLSWTQPGFLMFKFGSSIKTKTWCHSQLATFTQQLECPLQSPAFAFPRNPICSFPQVGNLCKILPSTIPPPHCLHRLYSWLLSLLPMLLTDRHSLHCPCHLLPTLLVAHTPVCPLTIEQAMMFRSGFEGNC